MKKITIAMIFLLSMPLAHASDDSEGMCGQADYKIYETPDEALLAAGITEEMAESKSLAKAALDEIEPDLIKAAPNHFAGSGLETGEDGVSYPVIAINGPVNFAKSIKNIYPKIKIVSVKYSLTELEYINELISQEILDNLEKYHGVVSIGVDPILNKVTIEVNKDITGILKEYFYSHGVDEDKYSIDIVNYKILCCTNI